MSEKNYSFNRWTLKFTDKKVESSYKQFIIKNILTFCRIAWGSILVLGGSFAFLDKVVYGENAPLVLVIRLILILISILVLFATFIPSVQKKLEHSSGIFISLIGAFSIFLISLDSTQQFSPYFLGIAMGYAGIFTTSGLGFRFTVPAMTINVITFNLVFIIFTSMPVQLIVMYNAFLITLCLIFAYAAYLVEFTSRQNFLTSEKLKDSLKQVKQLGGLLPICSSCKQIRDDKGYWSSVETYISKHSEVDFTHSLCPDCTQKLYPHLKLKDKAV